MSRRRDFLFLCLFGISVTTVAALGIGVRATYGAQTTADEPQYLLSALSFWEDGDLDIADELADERYRGFHEADLPQQTLILDDGSRLSPHDPLLPLLLAVPMGLGGWIAAKATLAVVGGAVAALTVWTARQRLGVTASAAYWIVGIFALAPPLAVYSTQVYPEIVAALILVAGFAALTGPFGRGGQAVVAVAVVALPWLAVKYIPVAAVLALAGLIKARRDERIRLMVVLVVAALIYVVAHLAIYDGLTAYSSGDHFVGGEFTVVGTEVDLWGRTTRLLGLLVDRGFGIAAWQPAFLLLPLAAGWAFARRRDPRLATALWVVIAGWLVATFVALTMHGWWFPGRQVVVVLPIALLIVAAWADHSRGRRMRLLMPLGALGVAAFGFLAVEGLQERLTWVVDFASGANPFYRSMAFLLPDYMNPDTTSWMLHGVWAALVVGLGWMGWHSASSAGSISPGVTEESTQNAMLT